MTGEHPSLWPHVELQADLYFNGMPNNPQQVLGRMTLVLRELVGEWFTANEFLNPWLWSAPKQQLSAAYGKFASGPLPVIEKLKVELEKGGSTCSMLTRPAQHWDGERWTPSQDELKVLVMDRSFIVMSRLDGQRL